MMGAVVAGDPHPGRLLPLRLLPAAPVPTQQSAELRGLTAALGPEKGAIVAALLDLSRRRILDGVWITSFGRLRIKEPLRLEPSALRWEWAWAFISQRRVSK